MLELRQIIQVKKKNRSGKIHFNLAFGLNTNANHLLTIWRKSQTFENLSPIFGVSW